MNAPLQEHNSFGLKTTQVEPLRDREFLHRRHQLSHQQIGWTGSGRRVRVGPRYLIDI